MQTITPETNIKPTISDEELDKTFRPKGAIAFFILLIILCLAIWYGIYFIMLNRI